MKENILLIGNGGREHALAWKLSQSENVGHVFVAPGNAGTANNDKISNIGLNVKDFEAISSWCKSNNVGFVMVGPEDPLALGIVDFLTNTGIPTFGPTASAARIEADKSYAKHFMLRHNIPTARFQSFTDPNEACKYIVEADFAALVVKASGLAAGKGVVVAADKKEACEAVKEMMTDKRFGAAGDVVVVEELLEGPEVSVLAFTDGHNVHLMPPAQDHKRLLDNDHGPNTGGMGAFCPYPELSQSDLDNIQKEILEKTVRGMAQEGSRYVGVLYAGLMLTKSGPQVLEFNCRFGDPETQSILSLMTSDLLTTLKACVDGDLTKARPTFDTSKTALGVVVVSGGYPENYKKGIPISGISEVERSGGLKVFHAGTNLNENGQVVTSGGRVLAVVATDSSLVEANRKATAAAAKIHFEGAYFRKDIGYKCFKRSSPALSNQREEGLQYKDSGVDIEAGDYLVDVIKPLAKMTKRSGCNADLGGFGGIFDLTDAKLSKCILASRTWGVGPKLRFAENLGHHYNIGFDLVAQCANHLITIGAEPLFFLDYYATGKLSVPHAEEVIRGVADACLESGCALIGGETAEMPGMYRGQDYDVAGIAIGALCEDQWKLGQPSLVAGDVVLGLTTSRLQHQDFEILQDILTQNCMSVHKVKGVNGGMTLGEEILVPPKVYVKPVLKLVQSRKMKRFIYVSDGLTETVSRSLPHEACVKIDALKWSVKPVFGWMSALACLSPDQMAAYSSCGLAALMIVAESDVTSIHEALSDFNIDCKEIGIVGYKSGDCKQVVIDNLEAALEKAKNIAYQHAPENFVREHVSSLLLSQLDYIKTTLPPIYDLTTLNLQEPVLVSGTDGVGTKLKIAQALNHHSTIGQDLVAMCVNDILANGAQPLFFTCYFGIGRLDPDLIEAVRKSVSIGCDIAGCNLVEEHISHLPSIYQGSVYDLGGFSVGVVEKSKMIASGDSIQEGDVVIGLPSSGLHSNGFSLVRKIVKVHNLRFDMPCPYGMPGTLGQDLLMPTKIYVKTVLPAIHSGKVKGFAHITGGGLTENIPRVLPPNVGVTLDACKWPIKSVFGWLQYMGKVAENEMAKTFNCGLGAVLIVNKSYVDDVLALMPDSGAVQVGQVVSLSEKNTEKVVIENLQSSLSNSWLRPKLPVTKKRVGVLISGSGTNLQALIDHTQNKAINSSAEIVLVISNVPNVAGLRRAERAGIKTLVIDHKNYKSRSEFDSAVDDQLVQHKIELVCLAGFMRILTGEFVNKWSGRMLNIHPSLLPSFKGAHGQKLALEAGVQISGCSVHFVAEEVDAGAILVQHSVPVYPGDTVETLSERIKTVEHVAYPKALELVASEQAQLGNDGKLVWNW
ncbi:trifunctional purine biosynthetic protein adenosine-3 [Biomphalaria pfeifferi]|uniref:Trifunctional purine biosynthetic protein adenosine-3 n=1 Tax=Biomphalaria pfeifferi TaxID=112525 RepID=A0AAD8BN60_BIOPF|nr:trifunctional purine biosynthetic protein adenosine-3 [Biomphalaria pfeifferi]